MKMDDIEGLTVQFTQSRFNMFAGRLRICRVSFAGDQNLAGVPSSADLIYG